MKLRSLARGHTALSIKVLAGIAQNGQNDAARVAAAMALLDRGWGRPPQAHTGEKGEGDIRVVVRHIVCGAMWRSDRCRSMLCQMDV